MDGDSNSFRRDRHWLEVGRSGSAGATVYTRPTSRASTDRVGKLARRWPRFATTSSASTRKRALTEYCSTFSRRSARHAEGSSKSAAATDAVATRQPQPESRAVGNSHRRGQTQAGLRPPVLWPLSSTGAPKGNLNSHLTREKVNQALAGSGVSGEIDLLSIDLEGQRALDLGRTQPPGAQGGPALDPFTRGPSDHDISRMRLIPKSYDLRRWNLRFLTTGS